MKDIAIVLGCSHSEIPVIRELKSQGFRVATVGNLPDGLGHKLSDIQILKDYSRPAELRDEVENLKPVGIIPGANDFAYLAGAELARIFGYSGYDSPEVAEDLLIKSRFRDLQSKLNLCAPKYLEYTADSEFSDASSLGFPLLVKPTDLSGGKGIRLVECHEQLVHAVDDALSVSRKNSLVIEEFIEGSSHACSAFIKNHKVIFSFYDNEYYHENPFLVGAACSGSVVSEKAKMLVLGEIEALAVDQGLVDGLMHAQFKFCEDNTAIIEITRRLPGDLYPYLVEMSTGAEYVKEYCKPFLGQKISPIISSEVEKNVLRQCIFGDKEGQLRGVELVNLPAGVSYEFSDFWFPERLILDHLVDKAGIVFFEFDDAGTMRDVSQSFYDFVDITYVGGSG